MKYIGRYLLRWIPGRRTDGNSVKYSIFLKDVWRHGLSVLFMEMLPSVVKRRHLMLFFVVD